MLSPAALERVSVSYRNGYYDGHDGAPKRNERSTPLGEALSQVDAAGSIRPFSDHDYEAGYKAGANDRKWADHYSKHVPA